MASSTFGISSLLQAEKQAKEKISEAKKGKARRLKAAKEEAKAEIKIFEKQSEEKFKEQQQVIMGSREDMIKNQEAHERSEHERISTKTQSNKGLVIDRIISLVCNVEPKLHVNYRVPA